MEEIEKALGCLPERTRRIIELRYGIGCHPHTYAAVAKAVGLSPSHTYNLCRRGIGLAGSIIPVLRGLTREDRVMVMRILMRNYGNDTFWERDDLFEEVDRYGPRPYGKYQLSLRGEFLKEVTEKASA